MAILHNELNPRIFDEKGNMRENIRGALLKIVQEFLNKLNQNEIPISVVDYRLVGSNAAYNYSAKSDMDIHIIADLSIFRENEKLLQLLYDYFKSNFNDKYDIKVKGMEVELYIEDASKGSISNGVYSIKEDKWIKKPKHTTVLDIDITKSQQYQDLYKQYQELKDDEVDDFIDNLYVIRKVSLSKNGEFGDGNLIFKAFRDNGYLDDLRTRQAEIKSRELSLESLTEDLGKITLYRNGDITDWSHGLFFSDTEKYYRVASTYRGSGEVKKYDADFTGYKVLDVAKDMKVLTLSWQNISGKCDYFDSIGLDEYECSEDSDYAYTDTDAIVRWAQKRGYDAVFFRGTEWDRRSGEEVNEYCIFNKNIIKNGLTEAVSPQGYAPKKTGKAYKVFKVKNGKLYPPMVANAGGKDTPIGVWLDAEEGEFAGLSKTGRPKVKSTGGEPLAYRPGWHLGDIPRAKQFDRLNKETGEYEFPKDFVWAECDYAMDVDYQPESDAQGYMRTKMDDKGNVITYKSDKYQHSLAGLPKLPKDGYYKYRTNPNPDTVPWVITGQMKVNRLLSDDEVNAILKKNGIAPIHRQGGDKTLKELGLNESLNEGADLSSRYDDVVNAELSAMNKFLDEFGFEVELHDWKYGNYAGMFLNSIQDDASVFPISLNKKLIIKSSDDVMDLIYNIRGTLAHEVGHGLFGYLNEILDLDDLDEEDTVEDFAYCYEDRCLDDSELYRILTNLDNILNESTLNEVHTKDLLDRGELKKVDESVTFGEYTKAKDTKYKKIQSKPINTLTVEDICYIYFVEDKVPLLPYTNVSYDDSMDDLWNDTLDSMIDSEDVISCYEYLHKLTFPLTIYRGIRSGGYSSDEMRGEHGDIDSLDISGKNNSRSWTTNINIYKAKNSMFKNLTNIVACEVNSDVIDNATTVSCYIHYTSRPQYGMFGEYEITLKKNFKKSDLHNLRFVDKTKITEDIDREMSNEYDSEGNQLTKAQAEFFKNSKVRDNQGRLLVAYHGTGEEFDVFDYEYSWDSFGFHFGTRKAAEDRNPTIVKQVYLNCKNIFRIKEDIQYWDAFGFTQYFLRYPKDALQFMDKDTLKELKRMWEDWDMEDSPDTSMWDSEFGDTIRDILYDSKYDCIEYINGAEDAGSVSYMAFYPEDIKAITNLNPTNSDNINEATLTEVYPNKGESKKDFISRFMSVTKDEYPDVKQRYAVANSYWERRNKKRVNESTAQTIVAYHSSPNKFTKFDKKYIDTATSDGGMYGKGFYFADKELAQQFNYSGYLYKVKLLFSKPYILNTDKDRETFEALINAHYDSKTKKNNSDLTDFFNAGYDGVISNNEIWKDELGNKEKIHSQFVVYDPSQITILSIEPYSLDDNYNLNEATLMHWGDLDYGRKADRRAIMAGRGTGHFGTGFYFVSKDKYDDMHYDYNPERPIYELDTDSYHLFKPKTVDDAYAVANSYWERRNKKRVNEGYFEGDFNDVHDDLMTYESDKPDLGASFITEDGTFINLGTDTMHGDIFGDEDDYENDDFYTLEDAFNLIKINGGGKYEPYPYIDLWYKPNRKQEQAILTWLDFLQTKGKKLVIVNLPGAFAEYNFNEYISDEILKDALRNMNSISESLNEDFLYESKEFTLYHGSQQADMTLLDKPIYLTDDKDLAIEFAKGYAFNYDLYDEDAPTLYTMKVKFNNPMVIKTEEEYDDLMDIVNIEETVELLKANNQDGIIYRDEEYSDVVYYMPISAAKQCKIIKEEPVDSINESLIVEARADQDRFRAWLRDDLTWEDANDYFDLFLKLKSRIKTPYSDMYWWMKNSNQEDFAKYMDDLVNEVEDKRDIKRKEQSGARLVYQDKDWKVYEITNYEASAKYGKGTKWCITGSKRWNNGESGAKYFNDYYSQKGIKFYYFIKGNEKYALALYPDKKTFEIYNAEDVQVSYIPDAPVIDEIGVNYYEKNDMNILINAMVNRKVREWTTIRAIEDLLYDGSYGAYLEVRDPESMAQYAEEYSVDGYYEYQAVEAGEMTPEEYEEITGEEFSEWGWGGDIPPMAWAMSFPIRFRTTADSIDPDSYREYQYWVIYQNEDEIDIDGCQDWMELLNTCSYYSDLKPKEFLHKAAEQLIKDIKDGEIDISEIENIGLSQEFLDNLKS